MMMLTSLKQSAIATLVIRPIFLIISIILAFLFPIVLTSCSGTDEEPVMFQVLSRGATVDAPQVGSNGLARFIRNGSVFYSRSGDRGGRGFNLAAINVDTSELLSPPQNFDTFGSINVIVRMIDFIDSFPDGTLILLAVADEAGLTVPLHISGNRCTRKESGLVEQLLQVLEDLGSDLIRRQCYWDSWAMIAIKGEPPVIDEALGKDVDAIIEYSLN